MMNAHALSHRAPAALTLLALALSTPVPAATGDADLNADGIVDATDLALFSEHWLEDRRPAIHVQWLGHAAFKVWLGDRVLYFDPWHIARPQHDADWILITHSHGDHLSLPDIDRVAGPNTLLVGPPDVVSRTTLSREQALSPGERLDRPGLTVEAIPAYNTDKPNHPRSRNWLGYVVTLGGLRLYHAGDTDATDEMLALTGLDVALLPAGGTYTMDARQAAAAASLMAPRVAVPMHWGSIVGTRADALRFANLATCPTRVLAPDEVMQSPDWSAPQTVLAHWPLDERAGTVAHDRAGGHAGILQAPADWRPDGGRVDGALALDGHTQAIVTSLDLNEGPGQGLTVSAWVKGGGPGQSVVSLSEAGVERRLLAVDAAGLWISEFGRVDAGRHATPPLVSETLLDDLSWHHVALIWDGARRTLRIDDHLVAADPATLTVAPAQGRIHLGATGAGTEHWQGLLDDVRIERDPATD